MRAGGQENRGLSLVIRVENRDVYLAALDRASIDMDTKPFAQFLAEPVKWSMEPKQ